MTTTPKPHPLFGSIVVFGASLGACGGSVEADSGRSVSEGGTSMHSTGGAVATGGAPGNGSGGTGSGDAGSTSTGGAGGARPLASWECDSTTQFFCDLPDGGCRCDASAPLDASACAAPYQFTCLSTDPRPEGCRCDDRRLDPASCPDPTEWRCEGPDGVDCRCDASAPEAPESCENTAQFHCTFWEPVPAGCWCDPAAPIDAEECQDAEFQRCHSYEPPTGCECVCCIIR